MASGTFASAVFDAGQAVTWGAVTWAANAPAGTAIVVSDQVGAAADLVADGVNGYVVPVGDVATLSSRLRQITSDRTLARAMGVRSLERISQWDFEADVAGLSQALTWCVTNN